MSLPGEYSLPRSSNSPFRRETSTSNSNQRQRMPRNAADLPRNAKSHLDHPHIDGFRELSMEPHRGKVLHAGNGLQKTHIHNGQHG